MITVDELAAMLEELESEIPADLYRDLNGGVVLVQGSKLHPESGGSRDLYIMGEYNWQPRGLGRYITIYYGSFVRVYDHYPPERQKEELRKILYHEFTHHLESMAGEKDLEIKDAIDLLEYRQRFGKTRP